MLNVGNRGTKAITAMAITSNTILVLPSSEAEMTKPSELATARSPETASSRPIMITTIHAGIRWSSTSEMKAAEVSSLSAMGSSRIPSRVICPRLRARYPSSKSVMAARMNTPTAQRSILGARVSSRATRSGTKQIRSKVNELGRLMSLQSKLHRDARPVETRDRWGCLCAGANDLAPLGSLERTPSALSTRLGRGGGIKGISPCPQVPAQEEFNGSGSQNLHFDFKTGIKQPAP